LQKDVRYRFQNAGDIRIELEEIGSKPEAVIAVAAGVLVAAMLAGARSASEANFYAVISHDAMVTAFGVVFALILVVHAAGFLRPHEKCGSSEDALS